MLTPAFCLSCYSAFPAGLAASHCIRCHQTNLLRHTELFTLSIAHIDCDAFYASIEKRDNPELEHVPLLIGGTGPRSVVCTACYLARAYGARSAMPMYKAKQLCPAARILPPNFDKYKKASHQIQRLFLQETDLIQPLSLDEAYLDLSPSHRRQTHLSPAEILVRLQKRIYQDVGITVSIGLAPNKFLAKLASDLNKPDGFSIIGQQEAQQVLAPMPIRKIYGVGAKTAAKMEQAGFHQIKDLQALSPQDLASRFGKFGHELALYINGHDDRAVTRPGDAKSVSNETTFLTDISAPTELQQAVTQLCQKVSTRLIQKNQCGKTIILKMKTKDFIIITRNIQLNSPTNQAQRIEQAALTLLTKELDGRFFRLIGVGVTDLSDAKNADPPELFDLI